MKKISLIGLTALALALTGCAAKSESAKTDKPVYSIPVPLA